MAVAFGKRVNTLMQNGFEEAHFDGAMDGLFQGVAAQAAQFGHETEEAIHGHVGVGRGRFRGR